MFVSSVTLTLVSYRGSGLGASSPLGPLVGFSSPTCLCAPALKSVVAAELWSLNPSEMLSLLVFVVFSVGCNECTGPPSSPIMPHSANEPICPKFQPNVFDPSRCHDCLRQRHLHAGAGETTEAAARQKSTADTVSGKEASKGVTLTPIPSQGEEGDTSSKVGKKRS